MKISIAKLRKVIRETILEEEIRLSQDSMDDQIDSILLRFEKDCIIEEPGMEGIPSSAETAMEGLVDLGKLLVEAPPEDEEEEGLGGGLSDESDPEQGGDEEAPPPEDEDPEAEKEDALADQTGDKDDVEPDVESEPAKPKIDLNKYAGKVSRLVTNYENLLDISTVIASRAQKYLENNYSPEVAEEFGEILARDFEIEIQRPDTGVPEEIPMAIGAAASGLGGA